VKSRTLQLVIPVLVVIALTPALCRAQAEINPDHFDGISSVAAVKNSAAASPSPSRAYGSFFLPFDVKCAGVRLTPGYYSLSVRQLGKRNVVTLTSIAKSVGAQVVEVTATPRLIPGAPSGILINRVSEQRTLTAIRLEQVGVTLFLPAGKEAGTAMNTELIPILSSPSPALVARSRD
jgi:hypothetical protein